MAIMVIYLLFESFFHTNVSWKMISYAIKSSQVPLYQKLELSNFKATLLSMYSSVGKFSTALMLAGKVLL